MENIISCNIYIYIWVNINVTNVNFSCNKKYNFENHLLQNHSIKGKNSTTFLKNLYGMEFATDIINIETEHRNLHQKMDRIVSNRFFFH